MPQALAAKKGYSQILWLFNDQVTEVGTMNIFFFWINKQGKKELVTAPLDGTILPGVTRDSILSLAREWKEFEVSEVFNAIHFSFHLWTYTSQISRAFIIIIMNSDSVCSPSMK